MLATPLKMVKGFCALPVLTCFVWLLTSRFCFTNWQLLPYILKTRSLGLKTELPFFWFKQNCHFCQWWRKSLWSLFLVISKVNELLLFIYKNHATYGRVALTVWTPAATLQGIRKQKRQLKCIQLRKKVVIHPLT